MDVGRSNKRAEERGLDEVPHCCFVVAAGGLGERLGFSGVKLALPAEITSGLSCVLLSWMARGDVSWSADPRKRYRHTGRVKDDEEISFRRFHIWYLRQVKPLLDIGDMSMRIHSVQSHWCTSGRYEPRKTNH